jgi:hypothetical protein
MKTYTSDVSYSSGSLLLVVRCMATHKVIRATLNFMARMVLDEMCSLLKLDVLAPFTCFNNRW